MKINTNMLAFIANKQLLRTENNLSKSVERLSSGLRLNHAKDNPAGMAISNKMRAQIEGLDRASENASDGICAIRIADGALGETTSILQRIRELAVQAANETNSLEDKQAIQLEIDSLKEEVTRISTDTEYNELPLLDGSLSARVYSEHVSRILVSDEVAAGNYKLDINAAATRAMITSENTAGIDIKENTTELGLSGTIDINGYIIEINETDTQADIYQKIRDGAEVGEATADLDDSGRWILESTAYGSKGELRLTFSDQELANSLGFTSLVEITTGEGDDAESIWVYGEKDPDSTDEDRALPITGTDMQVELRVGDDSDFSNTATVKRDGNKVTITDKNGFSISFQAEAGYSGEINLEVTNIGTMTLQIGANMDQNMVVSIPEVSSESLYIDDVDVTTVNGAERAIMKLDEAIAQVSSVRSKIGAYENRLDYSVSSLDTFEENVTNALSRLSDTDMADEMTTYTQQNVLDQAAISVLTQANDLPQQVLQLLQ